MEPFRTITPKRSMITRDVPHWRDHKPDLKNDFNSHCAYCNSYDGFRHTWFEVDHFIPKAFFKPLGNITLNQYTNLVYSCKFCNNKKLNKWPSASETVYNDGSVGFVDPCSHDYATHFHRNQNGAIMWSTALGKWMHTVAFRFDERERGIRLLYTFERLDNVIIGLHQAIEPLDKESQEYRQARETLLECLDEYWTYHKELIKYYDNL